MKDSRETRAVGMRCSQATRRAKGAKPPRHHKRVLATVLSAVPLWATLAGLSIATAPPLAAEVTPADFVALLGPVHERQQALQRIEDQWQPGFVAPFLEVLHLSRDRAFRAPAIALLERKTGKKLGWNLQDWYEWLWQQQDRVDWDRYANTKAAIFSLIDPIFEGYFWPDRPSTIRLDEVRWGGVIQDGIPPLREPEHISAAQAKYLGKNDVVFGIEVGGEARAYPKRILAWHEMAIDTVGGVELAIVYCTLCGTVIVFETHYQNVRHELGTSGFLFRSNKLMYDRATQSLWNTYWGKPVIGPLAGTGMQLTSRPVVTTTWNEWRKRHPETRVLSLDTGHQRDYSEGAAYRDYFATDRLMFNTPELDRRLKNKDEVFTLVLPEAPDQPLAIWSEYLVTNPVHHERIGTVEVVVLTDRSGANRAFESSDVRFRRYDGSTTAVDEQGRQWTMSEENLRSGELVLHRLPAQRSFWFGWYAAYPRTRLVK